VIMMLADREAERRNKIEQLLGDEENELNNGTEGDYVIPDNLEAAQLELIRHREFIKKKNRMMKEIEDEVDKRLKFAPSYLHITDNLKNLIDGKGERVEFPSDGIIGLYFGMKNCPACHRFDAVVRENTVFDSVSSWIIACHVPAYCS
jgi:hypothetical protein